MQTATISARGASPPTQHRNPARHGAERAAGEHQARRTPDEDDQPGDAVKTHVRAILRKLGARDRTQAVVAAYRRGLVPPT